MTTKFTLDWLQLVWMAIDCWISYLIVSDLYDDGKRCEWDLKYLFKYKLMTIVIILAIFILATGRIFNWW